MLTVEIAEGPRHKQVGLVLAKRGKVTAKNAQNEVRILKRNDPIYADDVVHTVRGANAQLKMQDENVIMLRGGCLFRVNIYQLSQDVNNPSQKFEYIGGVLRESRRRNSVPLMDLGIH